MVPMLLLFCVCVYRHHFSFLFFSVFFLGGGGRGGEVLKILELLRVPAFTAAKCGSLELYFN